MRNEYGIECDNIEFITIMPPFLHRDRTISSYSYGIKTLYKSFESLPLSKISDSTSVKKPDAKRLNYKCKIAGQLNLKKVPISFAEKLSMKWLTYLFFLFKRLVIGRSTFVDSIFFFFREIVHSYKHHHGESCNDPTNAFAEGVNVFHGVWSIVIVEYHNTNSSF